MVRSFRPATSAGVCTGFTELVMWRKPFSDQARPIMPLSSNFASSSSPISPSRISWALS